MVKTSKNFKFFALILIASTLLIAAATPAISTVKAQSTDSILVYVALGGTISANGTALTGGSTYSYADGTVVAFTATPGTGFAFLAWETATAAGGSTSTANPLDWTITGSGAIQAMFIPTTNTTGYSSAGTSSIGLFSSIGGSTNPTAGTYTNYTIGTTSAFTATPGSGFNFLCWEVATAAGAFTTTSNPMEYNVSANNCGLQAFFIPTSSTVTLPTATTTPTSTPKVSEFSSATVAIMAIILAAAAFGTYTYTKKSKK
jgi:hypothetical protein